MAFEPDSADTSITPISFSTGKNGAKLAWLPYRPTAGELRKTRFPQVVQAEFHLPARPTATGDDPMSDPFGDMSTPTARPRTLATDKKPFTPKFVDPTTLSENTAYSPTQETTGRQVPPTRMPESLLEGQAGKKAADPLEMETLPTLDEELATNARRNDGCPEASSFKPINQLTTDIRASSGDFPRECMLEEHVFSPRVWTNTTFTWKASGLCHKPLYFEQIQLERYGHSFGPYLQPVISLGHFFITVPVLPYLMGINPPSECMYTLGYYRPGSCAPYMLDPLPISVRAGLLGAAAWTGGAFLVP